MGPPPYNRSSTQPYQRPLASLDTTAPVASRKSSTPESNQQVGLCLLPQLTQTNQIFEVTIHRNSLGLGFSICGGVDAPAPWTNLIRIKRIFPLQPAWETAKLKVGDILLKVSGVPLSSLNLRQALDILRTSPATTTLQVCRVSDPGSSSSQNSSPNNSKSRSTVVRSYSYGPYNVNTWENFRAVSDQDYNGGYCGVSLADYSAATHGLSSAGESMEIEVSPATPEKEWSPSLADDNDENVANNRMDNMMDNTMDLLKPVEETLRATARVVGEFSITLTKVNGSLGFSLHSTDDNVLNHTIKAIVRDPAMSDGRLEAGDKLVSANGVDLSSFSHQELIMFLRQCEDRVLLGLYRDASRSQTPLEPESPTATFSSRGTSPCRKNLRYEAKELVRSLQSSRTSLEKAGLGSQPGSYSSGTLGRRRGRPFSPATQLKQQQHPPQHNSSSSSCVLLSTGGHSERSPVPTVESPVTPHNCSAPSSLGITQAISGLNLEDRLLIEEVEAGGCGGSYLGLPPSSSTPGAPTSPLSSSPSNHQLRGCGIGISCSPSSNTNSPGGYTSYLIRNGEDEEDSFERAAGALEIRSIPNSPIASRLRQSTQQQRANNPRAINNNSGGAQSHGQSGSSCSLPRSVQAFFRSDEKYPETSLGPPSRPNRPKDLNLFTDRSKKRQGYIFASPSPTKSSSSSLSNSNY